jgi:hypothetical protein
MADTPPDDSGFSFYLREDGIWVYEARNVVRATVDAWYETSHQHDHEYAATAQTLLRLIIIHPGFLPTPYAFGRIREAAEQTPLNLREANALIMPATIGYQITNIFMNRLPFDRGRAVIKVFRDSQEGVLWLLRQKQRWEEELGAPPPED